MDVLEAGRLASVAVLFVVPGVLVVLVVLVVLGVRMVAVIVLGGSSRRNLVWIRSFDWPPMLQHAKPRPGDAAAAGLASLHRDPRETQSLDGFVQHLQGHAEIETGAQEHVASQAAVEIEVESPHARKVPRATFLNRGASAATGGAGALPRFFLPSPSPLLSPALPSPP
jgi:hypothetical protein